MKVLGFFDKVYVINLDKRPDRLARIDARLKSCGIQYERVAGIEECKSTYDPPHGYGLAKIHILLMREILERGHETVLIFEDDAVLRDDFVEQFEKVRTQLAEEEWVVAFLGGLYNGATEQLTENLIKPESVLQTHAMAVRSYGIPVVLAELEKLDGRPIDFIWGKTHPMVAIWPLLSVQEPDYSDIVLKDVRSCLNAEGWLEFRDHCSDPVLKLPAELDLLTYFDRAYLITEPGSVRHKQALRQLGRVGVYPQVFKAIFPESDGGFRSAGVYGCYLSHLGVLKKVQADKLRNVLIFEDDVIFRDDFLERLPAVLAELKTIDWDIFYFHTRCVNVAPVQLTQHLFQAAYPFQTHAYAVNGTNLNDTIDILERAAPPHALDEVFVRYPFKKIVTYPSLAAQEPNFSSDRTKWRSPVFNLNDAADFVAHCSSLAEIVNSRGQVTLPNVLDVKVQWGGLGDVLMASAFVRGAAEKFKDKRVRLVVRKHLVDWADCLWADCDSECSGVIGENELHLSGDIELPAALDGSNRMLRWEKVLGVKPLPQQIAIPEKVYLDVKKMLSEVRKKEGTKTVLLAPFSRDVARTWPLYRWYELERRLVAAGFLPITLLPGTTVNTHGYSFHGASINGLTLEAVCALIQHVDLVVGNDSGPVFIAGALRKPTLAVCGYTAGQESFGWYPTVKYVQATLNCSPCFKKQQTGFRAECIAGCEALNEIKVETVLQQVLQILKRSSANCVTAAEPV